MKQHITIEQLNELSERGKAILETYILDKASKDDYLTGFIDRRKPRPHEMLLSIGDMIEFLDERITGDLDLQIWINSSGSSIWTGIGRQETKYGGGQDVELCDTLWEAVKEVLKR